MRRAHRPRLSLLWQQRTNQLPLRLTHNSNRFLPMQEVHQTTRLTQKSPAEGQPWASNQACLEGILWCCKRARLGGFCLTRIPLPRPGAALETWEEQGVWLDAWRALLGALDGEGLLKSEQTFLDGSFAPAKKGGSAVGKTKRGKGTKWMVLVDGGGLPLGVRLESGSPEKLRLRKPRSPKSRFLAPKVGRE